MTRPDDEPWEWWTGEDSAIAFVDQTNGDAVSELLHLPPCPVILIGDRDHPAAARFDAVLEPPFTKEALTEQAVRHPMTTSVLVQLLRAIDRLPLDSALAMESVAYGLLQAGKEHVDWRSAQSRVSRSPAPGVVHVERTDRTLTLILDRPGSRNAVDAPMRDALFEALSVAVLDGDIEQIRLRGAGPAFSVGADLSEFGTTTDPAMAHWIRARTLPALLLARCADRLDVHVQGACVGSGLEMAAFARTLTASSRAWFQLPEVAMGIIPGAGGCVSVSRRIGRGRALLMMLSCRRISVGTALDWGLVDRIVDQPAAGDGAADADRT